MLTNYRSSLKLFQKFEMRTAWSNSVEVVFYYKINAVQHFNRVELSNIFIVFNASSGTSAADCGF